MRPRYGKPDRENPEITPEEWKKARPAHEVMPEIFGPDGRIRPRFRGKKKARTKITARSQRR